MMPQIYPNSGFSDSVDESKPNISIMEFRYSATAPLTGGFSLITGFDKGFDIFFSLGVGLFFGGEDNYSLLFLLTFGAGDLLSFFSSGGKATYF